MNLEKATWGISRLGVAVELLAAKSGLKPEPKKQAQPPNPSEYRGGRQLDRWLTETADWLGLRSEAVSSTFQDLSLLLRSCGPAVLEIGGDQPRYLTVLSASASTLKILCSDRKVRKASLENVLEFILERERTRRGLSFDSLCDKLRLTGRKRRHLQLHLCQTALAREVYDGCRLLRMSPLAHVGRQLAFSGVWRHLAALLGAYSGGQFLVIFSWYLIGKAAVAGPIDSATLVTWSMTLLAVVPFRMAVAQEQGRLSLIVGAVFKRRLLTGILKLAPSEIQGEGPGNLLAKILESKMVENLSISGGFAAVFALVDLIAAFWVLRQGATPLTAWFLFVWLLIMGFFVYRYFRYHRRWTEMRIGMTQDLVERMLGHQTRLVQERRYVWYYDDDRRLAYYHVFSRKKDMAGYYFMGLSPRGWLFVGLLSLIPAIPAGASSAQIGITLGGIILGVRAFMKQRKGFLHFVGALVAWEHMRHLMTAAARPALVGPPGSQSRLAQSMANPENREPLLEAFDLCFRYGSRNRAVLSHCHVQVKEGEKILVEGRSGSGKSTLTSLLLGLEEPDSGLILFRGMDRASLGEFGWRKCIAAAPQFHQNRVFEGSLAFNLLMGRCWPPSEEDLGQAEKICRELGLGGLLDDMPSGIMQPVGNSGRALSHGEMSRLFIARALLQDAPLLIFDESFATLDPDNLRLALNCVMKRGKTLIVIAHP